MLGDLRYRLRALFRRNAMERELDEELQFHLAKSAEAHERAGHPRHEAMRLARLELDGVEPVKEDCRDARGVRPLEDLVGDVRYGLRVLRRAPLFTAVAMVTLALGIGANTAMFSLVNVVLRQPLPYPEPDQLVRLHGSKPPYDRGSVSFPNFLDWQAANHTFRAMAVSREAAFTRTGRGAAERVSAQLVSSDYFAVLDVHPLAGRGFSHREAEPGGPAIAILGERLWQRSFGAAEDAVGKSIILDGKSYAVIGVMPAAQDVHAVAGGAPPDVYIPIGQIIPEALKRRGAGLGIHGIGRLAPGVTIAQARADLAAITSKLAATYPDTNKGVGAAIEPLRDSVFGNLRPYVLLLFGAVGLVLLIACVNVANLMLARAAARSREIGIRLALGATAGRLIRQLLTESLLLAIGGGALGLLVAWWCADTLFVLLPRGLPHGGSLGLDASVLGFTGAISVLAGVLSGLTPALKATRIDLHGMLKEGGRGPSTTRYRAQAAFAIVQMAMAFVLLVGAGLLVRTLLRLSSADPGFQKDGVVTLGVSLSPALKSAAPERTRGELRRLGKALAAAPGVVAASLAWGAVPIEGDDQLLFWRDDRPTPQGQDDMSIAMRSVVGPGYLDTMRIPLLRGRFFSERDDERMPRVVVIDDAFARTYFADTDPIGKRVHVDEYDFEPAEIIGVVGHVKQWGLDQDETTAVRAQLYEPFLQMPDPQVAGTPDGVIAMVRTRGDTGAVVTALRAIVQAHGGENAMYRVRTVDELIDAYQATRRLAMYILAAFAALALVLSCVGIYGVVSYIVAQRTTEIGIRMALGARASDIMRLVVRQGARLVVIGVVLGLAGAIAVSPYMADLVYDVPPIDPVTFAAVACAIVAIALAAMVLPARRAMRLDPMAALRTD
ncbi:MAG TPA: ABC transporter permease [Kofleriaceae bacterium]|nr:ABC transporter permease [Kofleriaceae bacterium]